MKKGSVVKSIRNFLAMWAGILVLLFLGVELLEMAKTFVQNLQSAFEFATAPKAVLISMGISLVVTVVASLLKNIKKD